LDTFKAEGSSLWGMALLFLAHNRRKKCGTIGAAYQCFDFQLSSGLQQRRASLANRFAPIWKYLV
jgi:hypothetical protein